MNRIVMMFIGAIVGSFGFSLIFEVKKNRLIPSFIGCIIGTVAYLLCDYCGVHEFITNTVAAFLITVYSEIAARIIKSPAIVLQLAGIVVLVPGSSLYYTMSNLISKNFDMAAEYGLLTFQVGAGIASGLILGNIFINICNLITKKIHNKKQQKH